jgi:N-acetyl-anhydromuramyl-L-alanine amidase AmpD
MAQQVNYETLLDQIVFHKNYPRLKYYAIEFQKTQLSIHHTVSGSGVEGDIAWWIQSLFRIGTAFIIDREGVIHQLFSSKYYAKHLGVKDEALLKHGISGIANDLNKHSIGIELDSWGGLIEENGLYYPALWDKKRNLYVPNHKCKPLVAEQVEKYPQPYRGFLYYEKYTPAQIESLYNLLRYLTTTYEIPRVYNPSMWDVSRAALAGKKGIWSHVSYREDKSDCHPQPELIVMLKKLQKTYTKHK